MAGQEGSGRFDPFSLRGVLVLSAVYGLVHVLIRLIAGTNLAMDDPKENVFTQAFQFGYLPENPPLFEWLLTLVQQVMGPNLYSFLIVKYALLVFSAGFFYLAARRVTGEARWAAITVLSALSLYQIGWNYHQAFTHSLVLVAAVCFGLWAFLRLLQERRWTDYLVFGLAAGLGMMAKYNFAGFLLPVLLAALMDRRLRGLVLNWRFAVSVLIAVLMVTPHALWMLGEMALVEQVAERKLGLGGSHGERVGEGLGNALTAILSFFLPFLLVAALLARKAVSSHAVLHDPWADLCRRSLWIAMALILVGVIVLGVSNVTERYVVPFLLPGFIWLIMRLREVIVTPRAERRWVGAMVAVTAFLALLRVINVGWGAPPVCDECHRWIPFAALEQAIDEEGFARDGVYIANEEDTAGNLRRLLPGADVRSINLLFFNPVETDGGRPCYFVWSEELLGAPIRQDFRYISQSDSTRIVKAPWRHPLRAEGYRHTEWGISPVPAGTDFYRNFCTSRRWQ